MEPQTHVLRNGQQLIIREAAVEDAARLLDYVDAISRESDFLTFGPDEFEIAEAEERQILQVYHESDNQLYLVSLIDDTIVGALSFSAGRRPRVSHSGEFGVSVRKHLWGLGIGSRMLDALIAWARGTRTVTKLNLRVRTDNQRAIALYNRKGFVIEGTIQREILLEGTYYDQHWMGLTQ